MTDDESFVLQPGSVPPSTSGSGDSLMIDLSAPISAGSPGRIEPDPILHSSGSGESVAANPFGPPPVFPFDRISSDVDELLILPGLDLGSKSWGNPAPNQAAPEPPSATVSFDEYQPHPSRLPLILLGSYASAMTIALAWVLLSGRSLVGSGESFAPTEGRSDTSRRVKESAKLAPAARLPDAQVTTLGKSIRVGNLEVTPLDVRRGRVSLSRLNAPDEARDGEADTLQLRLRLRNLSDTIRFSPLDESYIRDRDRGAPDSFVKLGDTERIYLYPLAAESEWSIVGQAFPTLNPGEVAETMVVSSGNVGEVGQASILWRIRLRVGFDESETVGVRFEPGQITAMP